MQLVPSCQELYRNTLTYHTVRTSPPDLEECLNFIGPPFTHSKKLQLSSFSHSVI